MFALAFVVSSPLGAQPARKYQVKAAFLFNFVQFAEWPTGAFAGDLAPIRIGVLGDDPSAPCSTRLWRARR
jgi:hypothetical protein